MMTMMKVQVGLIMNILQFVYQERDFLVILLTTTLLSRAKIFILTQHETFSDKTLSKINIIIIKLH